jgi:hypothetical protein
MITQETKMEKGKGTVVKCFCDYELCGNEFWKRQAEIKRGLSNGRIKDYCCRRCSIFDAKNDEKYIEYLKHPFVRYGVQTSFVDELSSFKYFIKTLRMRYNGIKNRENVKEILYKNKELFVDTIDLKNQFEKQNGKCIYTGVDLILPRSSGGFECDMNDFRKASIDRIDSYLPYVVDNIQFISQMANWAKSRYSHDEMVKFCLAISNHFDGIHIDDILEYNIDQYKLALFDYFYKMIQKRTEERKRCFITVENIMEQWHMQQGLCVYTGALLFLPESYSIVFTNYNGPAFQKASLDRIDSSLPYTTDNIQFISQMANYAKNNHSHDEMIKFCQAIANHWKDK